MSRTLRLSDGAYAGLLKHKRRGETFSDVVMRLAAGTLETFGELERHLDCIDGALFPRIERVRRAGAGRKRRSGGRGPNVIESWEKKIFKRKDHQDR
jgi:hypothetical protein